MFKNLSQAGACAAVVCGLTAVNVAEAGVVVGAAAGKSQFGYEEVDQGGARKLMLAFEAPGSRVFLELAGIDSGEAEIVTLPGHTLRVSGLQVGVGFRAVRSRTGSALFLKGGIYDIDTESAGPGISVEQGCTGAYLGVGAEWMFVRRFGLRVDLERLFTVEDFYQERSVNFATVGPVIKFGRGYTPK